MKKKSPPYVIIGAILLGAVAVFAFIKHEKDQEKAKADAIAKEHADLQKQLDEAKAKQQVTVSQTPTDVRSVYYAIQPIEPGTRISPGFFEKKLTPKNILPDAFAEGSDVIGMYAIRKIEKGDPLTPRNVGKSLPYLSQRIHPGMRSISLKVFNAGDVNDTGGFVVDGDRVDLLFSTSTEDNKYKVNTQTIMQNVPILFVPGPPIKNDQTEGVTPATSPGDSLAVTFEVTPEQAQALIYLTNLKDGHFSMILRARKDTAQIKIKPFDIRDYDFYNLKKVQKTVDKSVQRVQELADAIEAKEKSETNSQGNTNETTNPTPPSP